MTGTLREIAFLARFFRVVSPVPPLLTGTFIVLSIASGAVIWSDVHRAPRTVMPVLLLQCFAASSGFSLPARRGHYDLLLTRGTPRWLIAFVHWVTSSAPGLVSWIMLAAAELLASGGHLRTLLASGTLAAVFVVSTLPWACTVALPRFAGGIGWLLVLVTCATTFAADIGREWSVGSIRIDAVAWAAWSFLLYPAATVGQQLALAELLAVSPAVIVATVAMISACRWVAHADVPLEAAQ